MTHVDKTEKEGGADAIFSPHIHMPSLLHTDRCGISVRYLSTADAVFTTHNRVRVVGHDTCAHAVRGPEGFVGQKGRRPHSQKSVPLYIYHVSHGIEAF